MVDAVGNWMTEIIFALIAGTKVHRHQLLIALPESLLRSATCTGKGGRVECDTDGV